MIIITGASGGIGKLILGNYTSINENIIGTYNHSKLPEIINNPLFFKLDISDFLAVDSFRSKIEKDCTEITLLNCAGISYNSFAHKSDPLKWKEVIEVNLLGTYHMVRAFLPIMRAQNFGRIINFSSVVSQKGTPGVSAYAASKAALWGLTKSLCIENGSKNITINNINLGYVKVGMGVEKVPEQYQEIIKNQIPSGEFCNLKDIISTIDYLRNTPYINGSSIDLNGGLF